MTIMRSESTSGRLGHGVSSTNIRCHSRVEHREPVDVAGKGPQHRVGIEDAVGVPLITHLLANHPPLGSIGLGPLHARDCASVVLLRFSDGERSHGFAPPTQLYIRVMNRRSTTAAYPWLQGAGITGPPSAADLQEPSGFTTYPEGRKDSLSERRETGISSYCHNIRFAITIGGTRMQRTISDQISRRNGHL